MKRTKIILIIALIIIQGCNKYSSPVFLKSQQKSVLGFWESVKFFIDNEEQNRDGAIFYKFNDDGSYQKVYEYGKWEFDNENEKLIMTPNFSNKSYELKILRLTNRELWIEHNSSLTYKYHFEKKNHE